MHPHGEQESASQKLEGALVNHFNSPLFVRGDDTAHVPGEWLTKSLRAIPHRNNVRITVEDLGAPKSLLDEAYDDLNDIAHHPTSRVEYAVRHLIEHLRQQEEKR